MEEWLKLHLLEWHILYRIHYMVQSLHLHFTYLFFSSLWMYFWTNDSKTKKKMQSSSFLSDDYFYLCLKYRSIQIESKIIRTIAHYQYNRNYKSIIIIIWEILFYQSTTLILLFIEYDKWRLVSYSLLLLQWSCYKKESIKGLQG